MNKMLQFMFASLLSVIYVNGCAKPASDPNAEVIKTTMATFMKENNIPGVAVEVYVDGKPSSYYFGYADKEKKTPVTQKTIFEVGSISKLMTSLLLAQQVDSAKVQLDDPVKKYITELPSNFEEITLKNLATHTSGLPFNSPSSIQTRTELETYLTQWKPAYAANEQWTYSNFGMGMLGYTLETVLHKSFDQLYRSKILSPLKMEPIALTVPKRLKPDCAQGYDKEGNPVQPMQLGLFPAAGGIKASASDMQHFLSAAIGLPGTPERILYPMRMTQAIYVKLDDKMQGLGWQIHSLNADNLAHLLNESEEMNFGPLPVAEVLEKPLYDGNALMDKTGSTNGFRAYIAVIPNKQSGIVLLTNKYISNRVLVNTARELLFKLSKIEYKHETQQENENVG